MNHIAIAVSLGTLAGAACTLYFYFLDLRNRVEELERLIIEPGPRSTMKQSPYYHPSMDDDRDGEEG